MKMSAPKYTTWLVAVILGVAGLLINFDVINFNVDAILLVGAGFAILAIASVTKGL